MVRNQREIDALEWKLGKRGFRRDPRPAQCDACSEWALFSYAIRHTNIGGRNIDWCHACGLERGWSRPGGGDRVQDPHFDLEEFLA